MADYKDIAGRIRTTAADGVVVEAQEMKDLLLDKSQQEVNADVQQGLSDRYTKEETYNREEIEELVDPTNYVSVVATNLTTAVTDLLPAEGATDTIYRIGNWDGTQYDPTVYALYSWNGTAYVCLAVRSFVGDVYDISANHPDGQGNPTVYADLAAALGTGGENIPADIRRGGMTVKFIQGDNVQSSGNKYVQYRLMTQSWSTTVADWQKIDDMSNIVSSVLLNSLGVEISNNDTFITDYIDVIGGGQIQYGYIGYKVTSGCLIEYDENKDYVGNFAIQSDLINGYKLFALPASVKYVRATFFKEFLFESYIKQGDTVLWKATQLNSIEHHISESNSKLDELYHNKVDRQLGINIADPEQLLVGKSFTSAGLFYNANNNNYALTKQFYLIGLGETYIQPYTFTDRMNIGAFVLYKADKCTVVKVVKTGKSYTCSQQDIEDGVAYIRFTLRLGTAGYPTFFLAKSDTLPTYEPYTQFSPASELSKEIDEVRAEFAEKLDKEYGHSVNLINPDKIVHNAYLLTNGLIDENHTGFEACEEFIPVNSKNILVKSVVSTSPYILTFAIYNAEKTYLRGIYDSTKYTYQSGDAYVRIGFRTENYTEDYPTAFACYEDEEHPDVLLPYDEYYATDYKPLYDLELRVERLEEVVNGDTDEINNIAIPKLYLISNDIAPFGDNTFWNPRDLSLPVYVDHLFKWNASSPRQIKWKENKDDHISIVAPFVANGTPEGGIYNDGVNVKVRTLSKTLTTGLIDKSVNLTVSSILNSSVADIFPKVLFIGDSVTFGSGSSTPASLTRNENNVLGICNYWSYIWKLFYDDRKANGNSGFKFTPLGTRKVTFNYDGASRLINAEGNGGWSTHDYLYEQMAMSRENPFYDTDKTWTGTYADELNAAGVKFSLAKYIERYKTLANDGETRLVPGATAGTEITSANINTIAVCEPNIVSIQLGFNDIYANYLADIKLLIKAIKNEYPNIRVILSVLDEAGTYYPEKYPQYDANDVKLNTFTHQGMLLHEKMYNIITDVMNDSFLVEGNGIFLLGNYFVQPTAYSVAVRECPNAGSLSGFDVPYNVVTGSGPHIHPSTIAHATWAYQFTALIKHILYEE